MTISKKPHLSYLLKNFLFIISGGALAFLYTTSMVSLLMAFLGVLLLAIASMFLEDVVSFWKSNLSLHSILISVCVLMFSGYRFYIAMMYSSKLQALAALLGCPLELLVLSLSIVCVFAASYFCCTAVEFIMLEDRPDIGSGRNKSGSNNTELSNDGIEACSNSIEPGRSRIIASNNDAILNNNGSESDNNPTVFNNSRIGANSNGIEDRILSSVIYKRILQFLIVFGFLALVVCSLNSSIWSDEAFSLKLIQFSYSDIVRYTAADVHPPLYYFMLKVVVDLFSHISQNVKFTVMCAKLFSVLAYAASALLCRVKLKNVKANGFCELLILCLFSGTTLMGYGIEIRMYGWAMFFVTGAFLFAKDIMDGRENLRTWGLLVIFTLCSAYTHYFALVSAAAVWLYLLIWLLINHRHSLKFWCICALISACGYLPWLSVFLSQTKSVSESYWISDITLSTVIDYFSFLFPGVLVFVFLFVVYHVCRSKVTPPPDTFYDCIGLLIPFTTIFVGIAASLLIRPVFISRYLIPACLCLWISVMMIWCKSANRQRILISCIIAVCSITSILQLYREETMLGKQSDSTLEFLASIDDNSVLLIDGNVSAHVVYTIATYSDTAIYCTGENTDLDVFLEIYDNVHFIATPADDFLSDLFQSGATVYCITSVEDNTGNSSSDAIDSVNWFETFSGDIEYLGAYLFDSFNPSADVFQLSQ